MRLWELFLSHDRSNYSDISVTNNYFLQNFQGGAACPQYLIWLSLVMPLFLPWLSLFLFCLPLFLPCLSHTRYNMWKLFELLRSLFELLDMFWSFWPCVQLTPAGIPQKTSIVLLKDLSLSLRECLIVTNLKKINNYTYSDGVLFLVVGAGG